MARAPEEKIPLPKDVEESNSSGAHAGDATSGVPETASEWASRQPVDPEPTVPLDAGDPAPLQPLAGTPDAIETKKKNKEKGSSGSGKAA